ncbi:TIGR04283 family arsenosugar biosynthesis glycosyltransferase [Sedimenticola thiotaurini]|uniref:Glycosyl transferase n=1 Tax=Sedimenticola thiotaurini TaxID=1543721 RepID=A0A0F7JXC9_9GAMM|nr:TIGR04283 family arsenosugar biosynthesis glycosyltransferase [Sedimenticola thiotaurini]AKH20287.1 glycosyl transferase [Sedimenticola thiotaurini]
MNECQKCRAGALSVVIPCLNEAHAIGPLLETLQVARADGVELILVDGGSRDDTVARAKPLVDRLIESAPGRARQMNAGAAVATGEVLWFLHADSVIQPDFPALICTVMASSTGGWGRFDIRLSGRHPLLRLIGFMMNWRSRLTGIATGDQGIFVRRELFARLGGFADIPLMEDVEISRRLKRCSRPLILPQRLVTSSRRWESRGIVRTILLMWRLRWAYFMGADPARLAERYR